MFDREAIDDYISKVESSLRKVNKPTKLPLKVGVDLGTAYIVIVVLDADDNPVACEMKQASVLRIYYEKQEAAGIDLNKRWKLFLSKSENQRANLFIQ